MEGIIIRKAKREDAAEIANVHTNSWREAYIGLIPQDYLNDRPLHFKNRYELWKRLTIDETQTTFVAQSKDHGVVGFVSGATARDKDLSNYTEVYCLYLLKKYHGKKIGLHLLKSFFEEQLKRGFKKNYLWVLANNPTISFYEKVGGKFSGKTKSDEIAGSKVTELCYVWENIDAL
jgi:GNAT superfamily N-acetyltransferase